MTKKLFVSTLCLFAPFASHALADCDARFEESGAVWLSPYNPFSASDVHSRKSLRVRNLSDETCSFRVYFKRIPAAGQFSDQLIYAVTDDQNNPLLTDNITEESSPYLSVGNVSASAQATVEYTIEVERGQMSLPGIYSDQFEAILVSDTNDAIDQKTLSISMTVDAVSSVNLAGGGLSTTVQFGKLENGKTRSLILEARSNAHYNIALMSQNHGRLLLDPPAPGQMWSVSYEMALDGVTADLDEAAILNGDAPITGERSHTLSFEITDANAKRAGIYKDVITATIAPQP